MAIQEIIRAIPLDTSVSVMLHCGKFAGTVGETEYQDSVLTLQTDRGLMCIPLDSILAVRFDIIDPVPCQPKAP